MILLVETLFISSILEVVKQRNGGMGRKHLLPCKPTCSPPWYSSSWSYSLFIVAFAISFVIIFVIFSNMATKQEVGTVKGVVWEEGRLLTQHILYWNRILLAIITMQGMISHKICTQWCLKLTVNQQNWCMSSTNIVSKRTSIQICDTQGGGVSPMTRSPGEDFGRLWVAYLPFAVFSAIVNDTDVTNHTEMDAVKEEDNIKMVDKVNFAASTRQNLG